MPRTASRSAKDGISIRDQWQRDGRWGKGKRWLYRIWDAQAAAYVTATFASDPDADKNRRTPGCVAGDAWAKDEATRLHRGESSARVVTFADLAAGYLASKKGTIGASHLGAIEHTKRWVESLGVNNLADHRICDRVRLALSELQAARPGQISKEPVSVRVKNRHIIILRSMGTWGTDEGRLPINPFRALKHIKTQPEDPRRTYTLVELRHIVSDDALNHEFTERQRLEAVLQRHNGDKRAAAEELNVHPGTVYHRLKHKPKADPWWLFCVLAAYTGFRSETLRLLEWGMVDWDAQCFNIPAEITKIKARVVAQIQPELLTILRDTCKGIGRATILPSEISILDSDQTNVRTQAYLARIGIPPDGRSVHAFRHSVAALLTASGCTPFQAMDLLGHKNVATSRHYAINAKLYERQVEREGWMRGRFYLRDQPPKQILEPAAGTESAVLMASRMQPTR